MHAKKRCEHAKKEHARSLHKALHIELGKAPVEGRVSDVTIMRGMPLPFVRPTLEPHPQRIDRPQRDP